MLSFSTCIDVDLARNSDVYSGGVTPTSISTLIQSDALVISEKQEV
jgi:hypothetical protein